MNFPAILSDIIEFEGTVDGDLGFVQLNGVVRFKRDFGKFTAGQVVDNLTLDVEHSELIVYGSDCEREITELVRLTAVLERS